MQSEKPIHAVIGVRRSGDATFYVHRSQFMENYPGVWSLFSIQYDPGAIADITDLEAVTPLFEKMSAQRLGGVPIRVKSYLTQGASDQNPMGIDVQLHLYEIELDEEPRLNPRYYTEGAWLTAEDYEERCAKQVCGLCLRLWSDYAWIMGYTDRPFIPHTYPEEVST
ncbi:MULTISPECIES: hypothetical protein [unclassified Mesorhizobium]|uniref:hypothetical protein n=1 Tax=unclassified Mesorhizobium TaxID=325217 RepID=UPI00333C9997